MFDSIGEQVFLGLDGNRYSQDTTAAGLLDDSFWSTYDPIQPQASATGRVVFDVPNRFVSELEESGNVLILNFSDSAYGRIESASQIGIIRTYG